MNISKKHIELLIAQYLLSESGIKCDKKNYFGELLVDIYQFEKYNSCYIRFRYFTEYESGDDDEYISFSVTSLTEQTREHLTELQEKTYIDKNCLYNIVEILKEL